MKLKDYIHYYLNGAAKYRVRYVDYLPGEWTVPIKLTVNRLRQLEDRSIEKVELALRRLEEMTKDEMKGIWQLIFNKPFPDSGNILWFDKETSTSCKRWCMMSGVERVGIELNGNVWADSDLQNHKFNPNIITHFLLQQGFDLFGLIDASLAIDIKSIQNG